MEKDTFKIESNALWIGGGILLLAGLGTGAYFYFKKKKENEDITESGSSAPSSSGFCKYGDDYPLKHGSCGKNVIALQKILHVLGADLGTSGSNKDGVDGKYGDKTQAGVKKHLGKTTASSSDIEQLKRA